MIPSIRELLKEEIRQRKDEGVVAGLFQRLLNEGEIRLYVGGNGLHQFCASELQRMGLRSAEEVWRLEEGFCETARQLNELSEFTFQESVSLRKTSGEHYKDIEANILSDIGGRVKVLGLGDTISVGEAGYIGEIIRAKLEGIGLHPVPDGGNIAWRLPDCCPRRQECGDGCRFVDKEVKDG